MLHSNTELLIDYWRTKKGRAPVLDRRDVDPAELAPFLPRMFMVGRRADGGFILRLAGQYLVDAHGRARAGDDLFGLWRDEDHPLMRRSLERALARAAPLIVQAETRGERGRPILIEVAFAPLSAGGEIPDRFVGLYQPLGGASGRFIAPLAVRSIGGGAHDDPPRLRLVTVGGRLIA